MQTIEAIFQSGVFKPIHEVAFEENQHVQLTVRPLAEQDEALACMKWRSKELEKFAAEHGYLPDSTPEIAADRTRDGCLL
jgi:predicted DNA-binding antitoxin AbrB/MazE fold protein